MLYVRLVPRFGGLSDWQFRPTPQGMRRIFLAQLVLYALYVPLSQPINRVFDDTLNSVQDKHDALVAAQTVFPLLFRQLGSGRWNAYAREKPISDLVMEEELEETELGKVKTVKEAMAEIDSSRMSGLDRKMYRFQYSTLLLDGTLTIMGTANLSYTERSIYLRTGGGMVIPCMLASIPMESFQWYDEFDDDSFSSKFPDAFRVNEKKQLSVHDAKPIMSGTYRCSGFLDGYNVTNIVYLYVYRVADPGLMISVYFRTDNCDEAAIALLLHGILDYLCGSESFETCVDEIVPNCSIDTQVDSALRSRLQLNLIRYDDECQEEDRSGHCAAEQRIARILGNRPFKDLRSEILLYIAEDDRQNDSHSNEYLFDAVRTLAEGLYVKRQVYRCQPGFIASTVENKPACLPCFAGTAKASLGRGAVCKECDIGSYAPSAALQYCSSCPPELGTIAKSKGNKRQDQCFTHKRTPSIGMNFKGFYDDQRPTRKRRPMKNKTKIIIVISSSTIAVIVIIGGILLYYKRKGQQTKQRKRGGHALREKQWLALSKVPSVTTLGGRPKGAAMKRPLYMSNGILGRTAKKKVPAKTKKRKARIKNTSAYAANQDNDSAIATTDAMKNEAKKVREEHENMTTEAKKLKASDENRSKNAEGSKLGKRSHSSKVEKASKTIRSFTPWTPGLATPVYFSSQRAEQSGYSSQIVAQPGNIPRMVAQFDNSSQIVAQRGNYSQVVAQRGNSPEIVEP